MSSRHPAIDPITLRAFAEAVNAHLREVDGARGMHQDTLYEQIAQFGDFAERGLGVFLVHDISPEDVQAFVDSRRPNGSLPTYGIRRARRRSVRLAFKVGRHLAIVGLDPTRDLDIGVSSSIRARPLTDDEIARGRSHSFNSLKDLRRPVAWALAEATARTSEMGRVRARDIDLSSGTVQLPGSYANDPRVGELTEWGMQQVRRRVERGSHRDESLIVWRRGPRDLRAASTQAITESLRAARLDAPDVRPISIAAWAGRHLLDEGIPIDEVARRLGMRSLDEVARVIGFQWRATS